MKTHIKLSRRLLGIGMLLITKVMAVNHPPNFVDLDVPSYIRTNLDDDNRNEEWDKDDGPSQDDDDDLVKCSISIHATSDFSGTVKVTFEAGGAKVGAKAWTDRKKTADHDLEWTVTSGQLGSSPSPTFYLEGVGHSDTFDDVELKAVLTSSVGTIVSTNRKKTTVIEVDLDVDSNNNNGFDVAGFDADEDKIEFSDEEENPGKIVIFSPGTNSDNDGVPDFADGFNLEGVSGPSELANVGGSSKFVPLLVKLKEPFDPAKTKVKFTYKMSKPQLSDDGLGFSGTGTDEDPYVFEVKKGGIRIWKENATSRTSGKKVPEGEFIEAGQDIDWTDLAESGRVANLYVEYVDRAVPEAAGQSPITMTATQGNYEATDNVNLILLPVEVNSMDRYLSGSIPESIIESFGGDSKFGLVFRNPSSGETYNFNKLSEAHVYDDPFGETDEDEDDILSNSEIAAWANGPSSSSKELTQDVVFYRKDGKLHFRTLFDQVGAIEIGLIKDGEEIGKIDWTLTPDAQIADLLETVDNILSGNYDDDGGIVVAAMQAGLSEGDVNDLRSAAASIQSSSSGGFGGFLRRNLTIKVNIPTWAALKDNFEQGVRKAGAAVDQAITVATFTGKGFCEGAWLGIKDDINSVIELGKMALNPAETAKTFYEGFEALIELDLNGWKNVGKTLVKSFLEKGNEGAGEWAEPSTLNAASYLVGFTCGYITEQVVITYITAGGAQALKAGKIGREIGKLIKAAAKNVIPAIQKTANNAIRVATIKAKNSIFRRFSQDVLSIDEVKKLKHMLQELELLCPL